MKLCEISNVDILVVNCQARDLHLHPLNYLKFCCAPTQELRRSKPKRTTTTQVARKRTPSDGTASSGTETTTPTARSAVGSYGSSAGSAGSGSEGPGMVRPPRGQYRSGPSGPYFPNQRLFASAPRDVGHRGRQHHFSITAESPPSDSVGFFFGATPPDNHRYIFLTLEVPANFVEVLLPSSLIVLSLLIWCCYSSPYVQQWS